MANLFSASSASKSTSDSSTQTQTAGDASTLATIKSGQRSTNVGPGASLFKIGRGASVTFESTDHGAVAAAQAAIQNAVRQQADTTAAALSSIGGLAETRLTGGENLTTEGNTKAVIAIAAIAGVVALLFLFFKR